MTDLTTGQTGPVDRFDRASAILKRYPHITAEELADLKEWFRKASAFDAASLTANDALSAQYALYRKDHIDRFTLKDTLSATAALIALFAILAGIGYLAP